MRCDLTPQLRLIKTQGGHTLALFTQLGRMRVLPLKPRKTWDHWGNSKMNFVLDKNNHIAVANNNTGANPAYMPFPPVPVAFRVIRSFLLDTGAIPVGATGRASLVSCYDNLLALSLQFDAWLPALRRCDNELLLFPECVDDVFLDCLQLTLPILKLACCSV
jgi:hypothetical protein